MEVSKALMINMVAADTKLSTEQARDAVDAFLNIIKMQLRQHQDVRLSGFGSFKVSRVKSRKCRNFKTGATYQSKERVRATFKQSPLLQDLMNGKR